jgi:hypothetical protein
MNEDPREPLSPAGQARRAAMLGELLEAMQQTQRQRRARRRVLAAGGCACVLGIVVWAVSVNVLRPAASERVASNPLDAEQRTTLPLPAARPACVTTIVQTDPSVLERCRPAPTDRVVWIDDTTLLRTLASVNRPTGLIRIGDRVRLSAPVTDAELGL